MRSQTGPTRFWALGPRQAVPWLLAQALLCGVLASLILAGLLPYSSVIVLAGPVVAAAVRLPSRAYFVLGIPALIAGLVAVLAKAQPVREGLAALGGLALGVGMTSELLHRTVRVTRQRAAEASLLEALHHTTLGLLAGQDMEELLRDLLHHACRLLGTPHGNLFLVTGDRMRCTVASGGTRWMQEEGLEVRPGEGITGQVWARRKPVVVSHYPRWQHRLRDPRAAFIQHAAGIPLLADGRVVGAVVVARAEKDRPFTASELALVDRFAQLASLVVQNAYVRQRLQDEVERRRQAEERAVQKGELLESLHATVADLLRSTDFRDLLKSALDRLCRLLRCPHGNLHLLDGDRLRCAAGVGAARWVAEEGLRLKKGEGLLGRAWELGRLLAVEDYASSPWRLQDPRFDSVGPALALPLQPRGRFLGGLFVARERGAPPFREEELAVASLFADLAALILDNASAHREAQDELERRREAEARLRRRQELLEALHLTTQGLLAGLATEELLESVVRRACELLGSAHGNLYLVEDGVLRCRVGLGAMTWAGQEGLVVRRGEGMVGRVWATGEPVVVEDYSRWPGRLADPRFDGLGSAVSVPLFAAGEFVGAFSVARDRTAPPFTPDEVETVVRFGQLASLVLHNAQAARAVEEQRAFYEELLDHVPSDIAVLDSDFRYLYANRSAVRDPELRRWLVGRDDFELCARVGQDRSVAELRRKHLQEAARQRRTLEFEEELRGRDGKVRYFLRRIHPVVDREGRVTRLIGYGVNITDRKRAELRLAHLALHDALTGLPNRTLFMDRLAHALERARRTGAQVAVLFVDLDRFKWVNDTLGHEAGDELLRQVAGRLRSCLRGSDTLARLAGDEFTVLLEDVGGPEDALTVAQRIRSALQQPFSVAGQPAHITASVGVALSGPEVGGPQDLLRRADAAMYGAKAAGRDRHQLFTEAGAPPDRQTGAGAHPGARSPAAGTSEPSRSGTG